jgi:hypothetical protein
MLYSISIGSKAACADHGVTLHLRREGNENKADFSAQSEILCPRPSRSANMPARVSTTSIPSRESWLADHINRLVVARRRNAVLIVTTNGVYPFLVRPRCTCHSRPRTASGPPPNSYTRNNEIVQGSREREFPSHAVGLFLAVPVRHPSFLLLLLILAPVFVPSPFFLDLSLLNIPSIPIPMCGTVLDLRSHPKTLPRPNCCLPLRDRPSRSSSRWSLHRKDTRPCVDLRFRLDLHEDRYPLHRSDHLVCS